MRTILLVGAALLMAALNALALAPGDRLPALSLQTAAGEAFDMTKLKGQVTYLDFWASWCGPCKESFPFMDQLQKEFGKDGFQVLAVSLDRKPAAAREFLSTRPVGFQVAFDPKGASGKACGITGMPTCLIVDRNGIVQAVHTGFRAEDEKILRQELKALLGGATR